MRTHFGHESEAEQSFGNYESVLWRKRILLCMIVITSLIPLFFVPLNEQSATLAGFKMLAKTGSLTGTMLLIWQFLLGFRGAVSVIIVDLAWTVNLHKLLGRYACFLVVLHPVFISVYYFKKFNENIFKIDPANEFSVFVYLGVSAFLMLAVIFVTSVSIRKMLRKREWYVAHLSSYLLLPLVLIHSLRIGTTLRETNLRYVWMSLVFGVMALFIYRLIFRFGFVTRSYSITQVTPVTDNTVEIVLHPNGKAIVPKIGQFVYLRRTSMRSARPYTVSGYDTKTGNLAITAKALGVTGTQLQQASWGTKAWIDGPYGVFTWEIAKSGRPLVMIAGGIGVTPFLRLITYCEHNAYSKAFLFYAVERIKDVAYKPLLESLHHVKVVVAVNNEPHYAGERGMITISVLKKYVGRDFDACEFLLCGPPVMVQKLEADLHKEGISASQIHHELFGW